MIDTSAYTYFNPRSPCGERPVYNLVKIKRSEFQSTLPVWGATAAQHRHGPERNRISIHAPRVGSDRAAQANYYGPNISIHAPRVGSDLNELIAAERTHRQFQSTLPVWGATIFAVLYETERVFQSTLPVWGATVDSFLPVFRPIGFQSTLPVWGATTSSRATR